MKEAQAFLDRIAKGVVNQDFYYWGITRKESPKMIGSTCLWNLSDDRTTAELGYDLNPHSQGKGIMSEAVQAVLNFGFQEMRLSSIEACTHKENQSSKKLLERNGFIHLMDRVDEGHEWNWVYRREA